jgi:hypothetical protein
MDLVSRDRVFSRVITLELSLFGLFSFIIARVVNLSGEVARDGIGLEPAEIFMEVL